MVEFVSVLMKRGTELRTELERWERLNWLMIKTVGFKMEPISGIIGELIDNNEMATLISDHQFVIFHTKKAKCDGSSF